MERKDFIEQVGLSGAAILIFGCMQSCSKSDAPSTNTNTGGGTGTGGGGNNTSTVDFSIDISKSPFDTLKTIGGFYVDPTTKIIIVKTIRRRYRKTGEGHGGYRSVDQRHLPREGLAAQSRGPG